MAEEPHSVGDVLDKLRELADESEDGDGVQLGHAVEAFGSRGYGPFLVVTPLVEISPLGGVPGVPTTLAVIIFLIAIQIVIGREHLWLPGFLAKRTVSADKVRKVADKSEGIARFLDKWFHGRLPKLTQGPFVRIAGALVILLTLTVPPLEILPFATTAPMLAILAFGLALMVRDGALMIAAFLLTGAALAAGVGLWSSRSGQ